MRTESPHPENAKGSDVPGIMQKLTHFDTDGNARMVDVSGKAVTEREAVATGRILVSQAVINAIKNRDVEKGDVLTVAQVAGIMAVKRTQDLIPMCHSLNLTHASIRFETGEDSVTAYCTVRTEGKTGVEMEAITGVSVALLTIYDMCKAIDKRMVIGEIHLLKKSGGKSGDFVF